MPASEQLSAPARMANPPPPATWRLRRPAPFAALWTAAASANLGDGLLKTGLPLFAVTLTSSPTRVAGVTLAFTLPWALLALPAGALVDRLDRRRLMAAANLARVFALAVLTVAATTDAATLVVLYAVAFTLGAAETLTDTAASALVPAVVVPERLEGANARLLGTETALNEFLGPPLAGAVLGLGITALLGGGAFMYALVAAAIMLLPRPPRRSRAPASLGRDIVDGLRFLARHRVLRTLTVMVAVMAGAWSAWQAVLVLYAVRGPMHLRPFEYGLLLSALAVGGLLGTALAVPAQRRLGARAVIVADILATTAMLATPALTANHTAVALATVAGGLGSGMWNVVIVTLRQRLVPHELLGRVGASARLFGWGTMPVGAALGGALAAAAGPRAVFALGAILTIVLVPLVRLLTPANLTGEAARR